MFITGVGDMIFISLRIVPALATVTIPNITSNMTAFNGTDADVWFEARFTLVTYLFDALQVIAQVYFLSILASKQLKLAQISSCQKRGLKLAIGCLIIGNFFQWINGSFVEFEIIKDSLVNKAVYGKGMWTGLVQFTLPFALFFRIESMQKFISFCFDTLFAHAITVQDPHVRV